ncbi:MAG: alanine--tRNA ligase, partial [Planctomycetales bacterium]|nr:alanine--tRNA ligase [Planctomycetales bacterium]
NYHIDNLLPIVKAAAEICEVSYDAKSDNGRRLRRITDHVRACVFAIHENVYPGPNKEKYVIRRLLRRAVLDGHQMGQRDPFLHQLVSAVADSMKHPYPELSETTERVANVIRQEEKMFLATIDGGLNRIGRIFETMRKEDKSIVDGHEAADLYQTYGVPAELFESIAVDEGFTFDWDGYKAATEEHRLATGSVVHTVMGSAGPIDSIKKTVKETEFVGYDVDECPAEIKGIVAGDQLHESLSAQVAADSVVVVLDKTPFYGESGGQVGDTGTLVGPQGKLKVLDTQKDGDVFLHQCKLTEGTITVGDQVTAQVDPNRRQAIRRAHSATHILHYALQKNLGKHAQQQGSKVDGDWLRFDFTNMAPVSPEQIDQIEQDVRSQVATQSAIKWETVPLAAAREAGAMMLFGEKYPDPVRMVSMGDFSRELCGGTHLTNTSQVEAFEVISEESVSSGVRRLVALTGKRAADHQQRVVQTVSEAAKLLGCDSNTVPFQARLLMERVRDLKKLVSGAGKGPSTGSEKANEGAANLDSDAKQILRETARLLNVSPFDVPHRITSLQTEAAELANQATKLAENDGTTADELIQAASDVNGVKVICHHLPVGNPNLMRQLIDQVRKSVSPSAVFLGAAAGDDKVLLVAGVSRDLVDKGVSAGNWVKQIAPIVGGGGGGRPDMAQAGGKDPAKLAEAIEKAQEWIAEQIG